MGYVTLYQHLAPEVHCIRVAQTLQCKHTRPRCVAPGRSLSLSFLISSYANPLFLRSLASQHNPHPLLLRLPSCLLPLNLLSFILTWMFIFTRLRIGTPIFASIKTPDHFHELCLSVHVPCPSSCPCSCQCACACSCSCSCSGSCSC